MIQVVVRCFVRHDAMLGEVPTPNAAPPCREIDFAPLHARERRNYGLKAVNEFDGRTSGNHADVQTDADFYLHCEFFSLWNDRTRWQAPDRYLKPLPFFAG